MTITQYLRIKKSQEQAIKQAERLMDWARSVVDMTFPQNNRPAIASDIKVGAIIWYKEGDDGPFFQQVAEVLKPDDLFKAFVAENGCRYGLDDAFVEILDQVAE